MCLMTKLSTYYQVSTVSKVKLCPHLNLFSIPITYPLNVLQFVIIYEVTCSGFIIIYFV
jgi:hypothetical protein